MNRIQSSVLPNRGNLSPRQIVEQSLMRSSAEGVPHTLFAPMHYERKYAYPLVVWLHGPRDNEQQLRRIMPLVSMRNYVAVAPRGSHHLEDVPGTAGRFEWRQSDLDVEAAIDAVDSCIEQASTRFNVNRSRVFLAGFASGGTMAFRVGLARPEKFAGVLSIGGPLPHDHGLLLRYDEVRRLPLFVAYGRDSRRYSIDMACDDLRLLHCAGMAIALRQYPCGDELTTKMLSDMDAWIMGQVTGSPAQFEEPASFPPEPAS
jgi:phospholipase/carboxylesterase